MKAMSQSEIAKMLNVVSNETKDFDLRAIVKCVMSPKYMASYTIDCFGIIITEKESGKTELLVKYYTENKEVRKMNWSQFKASEKIKIQENI
jgi:hypothetical protein